MASRFSKMKAIKFFDLVIKDKSLLLSHPKVHFHILNMFFHMVAKFPAARKFSSPLHIHVIPIQFTHSEPIYVFRDFIASQEKIFLGFVGVQCQNFSTRSSPCIFSILRTFTFQRLSKSPRNWTSSIITTGITIRISSFFEAFNLVELSLNSMLFRLFRKTNFLCFASFKIFDRPW